MKERIKARAMERLAKNDDAHGFSHAERVAALAEEIRKHEGGDGLVVFAASYMHDSFCHGGRESHASEKALPGIKKELLALEFPADKAEAVLDAIRHHEDYDFHDKKTAKEAEQGMHDCPGCRQAGRDRRHRDCEEFLFNGPVRPAVRNAGRHE